MAEWIWCDTPADIHQFARFRKKINIAESRTYNFRISADSNFVAFCDGKEFLRGQYSDFPWDKTYTDFQLELTAGEHLIAIEVYYCGADCFLTSWRSEQPGLWCELENICESDSSWKSRYCDAYLRNRIDKVTTQLGFVLTYDAAADENFASPDFDDSHWHNAVKVEKNVTLSPRPVPPMLRGEYVDGEIVKSGKIYRELPENKDLPYAAIVDSDTYDSDKSNGFYRIFDVGCERSGLIVIECEAAESNICIDLSHGEHLDIGRVHNKIGTRNYTDRYFTAKGHQRYILPRRTGCRYIQLNIVGDESDFAFIKCGMEEENLPLPEAAPFECGDAQAMKLRENSIRTLRCCMHEHYEDCPWREQSLYSYDSRNQIMFGYYLWGNYEYATQNWHLLAKGAKEDGFLHLTAPSKSGPPISNFSVVYITAMLEHYMYYGKKDLFDSLKNCAEKIVKVCTEHIDEKSGLFMTSHIEGMWHFYEWRDGLAGECKNFPAFSKEDCLPKLESIYNLYLIEMFEALYKLSGDKKYSDIAEGQKEALRKTFYDRSRKCMLTRFNDDRLHGIVQVLAIIHGIVPEEDIDQLLERVYNEEFITVSISSMRYYLELLMSRGGKFIKMADELIKRIFGKMLANGSTTMWETDIGAADFSGAGSLCHGWSALPIYYYYRYLMGIMPIEPGFKKFAVDIYRMEEYGDISGEVVTPHGNIKITYDKNGDKLNISAPAGTQAVISERTSAAFRQIEIY